VWLSFTPNARDIQHNLRDHESLRFCIAMSVDIVDESDSSISNEKEKGFDSDDLSQFTIDSVLWTWFHLRFL